MSAHNHPAHYRADSGHECIDVIEQWRLGFCLGTALKYICRVGLKASSDPIEDLRKADWYARRAQNGTKGPWRLKPSFDGPHRIKQRGNSRDHVPTSDDVARAWGMKEGSPLWACVRAIYTNTRHYADRARIVNQVNLALLGAELQAQGESS